MNTQICKLLVKGGSDLNLQNEKGHLSLNTETLTLILTPTVILNPTLTPTVTLTVTLKCDGGDTALHYCHAYGYGGILDYLLRHGTN